MADIIPHNMMELIANGTIDLDTDTLKVALIDDTYTPGNADDTFESGSDPFDSEIATGNGYTAGGITVGCTVTEQAASSNVKVDISDVTWTASGGSIGPARYAVLWDDTATNDPLVYIFDLTENKTAGDGTEFKITIDSDGLFTIAQS